MKWLEDTGEVLGLPTDAKLEWQIRAGYRRAVAPGWTVDLGAVRYEFPSSRRFGTALDKPETTEVYAGASWGPATLKYSYATTRLFGVPDSKGSDYLELAVNQPVMGRLTLNASVGRQRYKGIQPNAGNFDNGNFDYTAGSSRDLRHRHGIHSRRVHQGRMRSHLLHFQGQTGADRVSPTLPIRSACHFLPRLHGRRGAVVGRGFHAHDGLAPAPCGGVRLEETWNAPGDRGQVAREVVRPHRRKGCVDARTRAVTTHPGSTPRRASLRTRRPGRRRARRRPATRGLPAREASSTSSG